MQDLSTLEQKVTRLQASCRAEDFDALNYQQQIEWCIGSRRLRDAAYEYYECAINSNVSDPAATLRYFKSAFNLYHHKTQAALKGYATRHMGAERAIELEYDCGPEILLQQFWKHITGLGANGDTRLALACLEVAANNMQYGPALTMCGYLHEHGIGYPMHKNSALQYYQRAAEAGDFAGNVALMVLDVELTLTIRANTFRALNKFLAEGGASRIRGDARILNLLYKYSRTDADKYLRLAAECGQGESAFMLSRVYLEDLHYLRIAADDGYKMAIKKVMIYYAERNMVEQCLYYKKQMPECADGIMVRAQHYYHLATLGAITSNYVAITTCMDLCKTFLAIDGEPTYELYHMMGSLSELQGDQIAAARYLRKAYAYGNSQQKFMLMADFESHLNSVYMYHMYRIQNNNDMNALLALDYVQYNEIIDEIIYELANTVKKLDIDYQVIFGLIEMITNFSDTNARQDGLYALHKLAIIENIPLIYNIADIQKDDIFDTAVRSIFHVDNLTGDNENISEYLKLFNNLSGIVYNWNYIQDNLQNFVRKLSLYVWGYDLPITGVNLSGFEARLSLFLHPEYDDIEVNSFAEFCYKDLLHNLTIPPLTQRLIAKPNHMVSSMRGFNHMVQELFNDKLGDQERQQNAVNIMELLPLLNPAIVHDYHILSENLNAVLLFVEGFGCSSIDFQDDQQAKFAAMCYRLIKHFVIKLLPFEHMLNTESENLAQKIELCLLMLEDGNVDKFILGRAITFNDVLMRIAAKELSVELLADHDDQIASLNSSQSLL